MIARSFLAAAVLGLVAPTAYAQSPAFSDFERVCERGVASFDSARSYFENEGWTEATGAVRAAGELIGGFDPVGVEVWYWDDDQTFLLATVSAGEHPLPGHKVRFYCRLLRDPAREDAVVQAMTDRRGADPRRTDRTATGMQYLWGPKEAGDAYLVQTSNEDRVYVYIAKLVVEKGS